LDVVESVSLCQSDLSRSVLSHLLMASQIVHLELGNSNFRKARVELHDGSKKDYQDVVKLTKCNAENNPEVTFLKSNLRLTRLNRYRG
jgi:hypothetical protein